MISASSPLSMKYSPIERTGVGCDVLHGRAVGCGSGDDDRVVHRALFFELADDAGNRRCLLADRDVNTFNAGATLVDDRIDRERGLAGLAIADDQLALAAADRHHRVNRLQAGLHRLRYRLAFDNARRNLLDRRRAFGLDRALAVDRVTERVDDPTEQRIGRSAPRGCGRSS